MGITIYLNSSLSGSFTSGYFLLFSYDVIAVKIAVGTLLFERLLSQPPLTSFPASPKEGQEG